MDENQNNNYQGYDQGQPQQPPYQAPPQQPPYQAYQQPQQQPYQQAAYQQPPFPGQGMVPPGYEQKSKLVAGLLQFFLGYLGIGRFYLGNIGMGVAQLLTFGGCGVWAIIDAILIFTGSVKVDGKGVPLKD